MKKGKMNAFVHHKCVCILHTPCAFQHPIVDAEIWQFCIKRNVLIIQFVTFFWRSQIGSSTIIPSDNAFHV